MKTKWLATIGIVLSLNMATSAMVINNHCKEKEGIRTESESFNEDYLFMGHELNFSGEAEDLIFLGKRLTFDGKTKLGLIALCENLVYSGSSGNGIIAGGMNIVINGTIASNSYIGCKSLNMSDKAVVNGNIFVGCAKLSIDGTLNGNLYAGAGEVVINKPINGNVTVYGGRIVIGENGRINGNLTYAAKEKLSEKDESKVTGVVKIDESLKGDKQWNDFINFKKTWGFLFCLVLCISCLAIGCLLLFLPVFNKLDAKQSAKIFWKTALWGLIPTLMYPALVVLCFALVITIPFAFVLILAFIPLFFIASIIGITLVGKYLVAKFKWNVQKRHSQFLIGMAACAILSIIPFINFLSMIFVTSLGWGMYLSFIFNKDLTIAE